MKLNKCEICGTNLVKNGKTSSGKQRWYCKICKHSSTVKYDNSTYEFIQFINWLLNNKRLKNMPGHGRSFQRRVEKYWKLWPMASIVDGVHKVIFVDGIYLAKNVVLLIESNKKYVLSWYLARAENSKSWGALISRIAPPEMVDTDGSEYTHERVRSARNSLDHLIASKTLFSFTNVLLSEGDQLPSTNNAIEGGVNSQFVFANLNIAKFIRLFNMILRPKICSFWLSYEKNDFSITSNLW